MQLAQYAIENNLQEEEAFCWWIKPTLKHKKSFIRATQARYAKHTHKFGIQVPATIQEALKIDQEMKTTFWYDAIQKEMANIRTVFHFLDECERVPPGHKWIKCHLVFDVKMDLTRKARYVAGGHVTNPPSELTYSSVVMRDSMQITLLLAAQNDVELLAMDIGNAYLNADTKEKVYTMAGPEFGELEGRKVIIVRALNGLQSSCAAWIVHLANTLRDMGFTSCLADANVWYHSAKKPCGYEYYEYV